MLFSVAVDLPEGGFFEYSTESILQFLQAIQMFGNTDIKEVEDDEGDEEGFDIPAEVAQHFAHGEEYEYDEASDCWCWYDEEFDAWYALDVESGEWLLVEDEAEEA